MRSVLKNISARILLVLIVTLTCVYPVCGHSCADLSLEETHLLLRQTVDTVLLEHPHLSSVRGSCVPLSEEWSAILRNRGFDADVVLSIGSRELPQKNGIIRDWPILHAHVRVKSCDDQEIIVDPSYGQFFEREVSPNQVFVGTPEELLSLFEHHAKEFGHWTLSSTLNDIFEHYRDIFNSTETTVILRAIYALDESISN